MWFVVQWECEWDSDDKSATLAECSMHVLYRSVMVVDVLEHVETKNNVVLILDVHVGDIEDLVPELWVHVGLAEFLGVIKDVNSSDPFVRIYKKESDGVEDYVFQSKCKTKTLDPSFNDKYRYETDLDDTPSVVFSKFTMYLEK